MNDPHANLVGLESNPAGAHKTISRYATSGIKGVPFRRDWIIKLSKRGRGGLEMHIELEVRPHRLLYQGYVLLAACFSEAKGLGLQRTPKRDDLMTKGSVHPWRRSYYASTSESAGERLHFPAAGTPPPPSAKRARRNEWRGRVARDIR